MSLIHKCVYESNTISCLSLSLDPPSESNGLRSFDVPRSYCLFVFAACRTTAEEFMEQLRPIFDALRQREELPCSYPLHVGSTHGTKQAFVYGHTRMATAPYHSYHQQHWVNDIMVIYWKKTLYNTLLNVSDVEHFDLGSSRPPLYIDQFNYLRSVLMFEPF